ncbi:MAG: glycosyltransferase [Cyanobacteria bacterium P01_H01_bin.15]
MNLMIFEPWHDGHHSTYLRYLLSYWQTAPSRRRCLHFVLSHHYQQQHSDIVQSLQQFPRELAQVILLTPTETENLESLKQDYYQTPSSHFLEQSSSSLLAYEHQLFCQYAKSLKITQGIVMYLCINRMAAALNIQFPCGLSGIYFNPQFHYSDVGFAIGNTDPTKQLKEKFILSRFLKHPQLSQLFCLDNFAVETAQRKIASNKLTYLPDPIQLPSSSPPQQLQQLKESFDIERDRRVFLLFGALSRRKGIMKLLESLRYLPSVQQQQITLLLIGQPESPVFTEALHLYTQTLQQRTFLQIVSRFEFIPEPAVDIYFQISDIILATYPRHVGMSGILLKAAAAEKPLLGSNFGLMGRLIESYELGVTVNAQEPHEIAKGLSHCLNSPLEALYNPDKQQILVQHHYYPNFCETLLNGLQSGLSLPGPSG